MSSAEIQKLKLLIAGTCAYYGHAVEDAVLALYVEDLADLPFEPVAHAIREARRDPKTTRFPLPAIIRDKIQPADTEELQAAEAAGRIVDAVAKYGWNNPESAKSYIGELGWLVIARDGGWRNVCESLNHENVGILKAQWRKMAEVQAKRAKIGLADTGPSLPSPVRSSGGLTQIGFVARSLPPEPEDA